MLDAEPRCRIDLMTVALFWGLLLDPLFGVRARGPGMGSGCGVG